MARFRRPASPDDVIQNPVLRASRPLPGKAKVVTSELPIERWYGWIGDENIADAMLDRLMQRHHRVTLVGESLTKASPKRNILKPELDQN